MPDSESIPEDNSLLVRFLKIYDNLPLEERLRVVLVLDKEPMTWRLARNYLLHSTDINKKSQILNKLRELRII
jgi:hypothetical protein